MRKSLLALLSLLVVVSLFLTACGSAPTEEPVATEEPTEEPTEEATEEPTEEATEAPAEEVELSIWVMPNGADPQAAIDAEIAAFNELYPNIKVTAEIVGWGDAYGRIQTALQSGEGPCITQLGTTWVPTFGTMGGMHVFTEEEIAALGGEENFVPASWSTASIEGSTVAVPWFADVRAIAYRADLFEDLGIDPEVAFADLDSFIEALETIKEAAPTNADGTAIAPFLHPGRNDWNVWQNASGWIWAYGGELLNEDGTEATFNSPEAVAGITRFNGLYALGLTPEDTLELNSSQADARFGEGTVATYMTGPWIISNARNVETSGWVPEAAEGLAFAAFPAGPGGQYTFIGGSNLGVMDSCENPAEAFEFVKYLLGKESQIRYANAVGMLPSTMDGQSDPIFTEDPLFSVFIDAAVNGKTSNNIAAWGQVENNLQTALQALWEDVAALGIGTPIDEATVQERLDEAVETVNTLLAQ